MINWEDALFGFLAHLKFEKSLSENSVSAYKRDMQKLTNWALKEGILRPTQIDKKQLQDF